MFGSIQGKPHKRRRWSSPYWHLGESENKTGSFKNSWKEDQWSRLFCECTADTAVQTVEITEVCECVMVRTEPPSSEPSKVWPLHTPRTDALQEETGVNLGSPKTQTWWVHTPSTDLWWLGGKKSNTFYKMSLRSPAFLVFPWPGLSCMSLDFFF